MTELAGAEATLEVRHDEGDHAGPVRTRRGDAWLHLRRNPMFWISMVLIVLFVVMAIAPGLFTDTNPR